MKQQNAPNAVASPPRQPFLLFGSPIHSSIFSLVHAANMAKRDPETGKFLKREDGKIIKPKGWKAPDVEGEVVRQDVEGSWS